MLVKFIIGKRISELRKELKLNQRELAAKIGVSQPTVAAWEKGENEPKATHLCRLAKFFEVSVDYLMGLEDIR